ncbi:hypothetical protein AVEN_205358-1, partial [Araneus ventricosus]
MNYFSVIRPPAGQITQPQSCAFRHVVDSKRSTLDRRSLSATRVWPTQTVPRSLDQGQWTPLGLCKAGQFYYPLRSSCVSPGASLCGLMCREKEVGETSQPSPRTAVQNCEVRPKIVPVLLQN